MTRRRSLTTGATYGGSTSSRRFRSPDAYRRKIVAVLFPDVAGYSKLDDRQIEAFLKVALPSISELLKDHLDKILELNTWGDAIILVSEDINFVARFALDLRDFYRNTNWGEHNLPNNLNCRIGLHSGSVFIVEDPLRRQTAISGTQITLTARIEPITPIGQAFATDTFISLLKQIPDKKIAYDDAGVWSLAKAYGDQHLNCLRRDYEPEQSFERTDATTDHSLDHAESHQHKLDELSSALLRKSSETSDLKSLLETTSAAFGYLLPSCVKLSATIRVSLYSIAFERGTS
jgi:class 3 adenylate cyclase